MWVKCPGVCIFKLFCQNYTCHINSYVHLQRKRHIPQILWPNADGRYGVFMTYG